jgi:hypothetical protein
MLSKIENKKSDISLRLRASVRESVILLLLPVVAALSCGKDDAQDVPVEAPAGFEFSAIPNAFLVDMEGGWHTAAVVSLCGDTAAGYRIAACPEWLQASISEGSLGVRIPENEGVSELSGAITLEQQGSGKLLEVRVRQRAVLFPDAPSDAPVPPSTSVILSREFGKDFSTLIGYSSNNDFCKPDHLVSNDEPFVYTENHALAGGTLFLPFTYTDVGINKWCATAYNRDVPQGFVHFNRRSARGGAARPSLVVGEMYTVSVVRFILSAGSLAGRGMALYKSENGGAYEPVGVFKPDKADVGKIFTVAVNSSNVSLKFAPVGNSGYYRLHKLEIHTMPFRHDGSLLIDENFQTWIQEGVDVNIPSSRRPECGWLMAAASRMYGQDYEGNPNGRKVYPNWTVTWSMQDYALSPSCPAGVESDSISAGYVSLQAPLWYSCGGHTSNGHLTTSELPSVSRVRFSMSYDPAGIPDTYGAVLWKKSRSDADWTYVKGCSIEGGDTDKTAGRIFTADINEENVQLRIVARWPLLDGIDVTPCAEGSLTGALAALKDVVPLNTFNVHNRAVRIHDLQVWSMEKN